MKALTVQQPWAWAIIHGGKDIENRTQAWTHRGPLAIHAGARLSDRGMQSTLVQTAIDMTPRATRFDGTPLGAIIGVVDLTGAHVAEDGCCESIWAERHYDKRRGRTRHDLVHLELDNPRPLVEPYPLRGSLGLWNTAPGPIYDRLEARTP